MTTDLCYIYGPRASGKGILCRLLDGHSSLGVTIHHDAFPRLLDEFVNTDEVSGRLLYYRLRSGLNKTRYYMLEDYARGQGFPQQISSSNTLEKSIKLDFHQMEKDWISSVGPKKKSTDIIKKIFDALFTNIREYTYNRHSCKYYVGMGDNKPNLMRKLIQNEERAKVIFIHRDPREVIASLGSRSRRKSIQQYIQNGRIFKEKQMIESGRYLKKEYPSRILEIDFRELILNSEQTINRVASFLNIGKENRLYFPSFCGNELTPTSDYIGEIKDNWEELASQHERCALDFQSGKIPDNITLPGIKLYLSSLGRKAIKETHTEIKRRGRDILS